MPKFAQNLPFLEPLYRHSHGAKLMRREVHALGNKLRFKLRTQGKLNLVERHLLRSFPELERQLCGPSVQNTANSLFRALLRPVMKCSVGGFILFTAITSLPGTPSLAGFPKTKLAEAENLTPVPSKETPAKQETSQLAIALLNEQKTNFSLELERNVDFSTFGFKPQIPAFDPRPRAVAPKEERTTKEEGEQRRQIQLNVQRGLVKFISGIIAAFRPSIGDCGGIARLIVEISEKEQIDPIYVASVIAVESRFSNSALSGAGARGLMQLMPMTARELADSPNHRTSHLSDPRINISLGIQYLKQLEERYRGNKFLVLSAYNWGPANVDNAGKRYQNIPTTVRRYANTVLERTLAWRRHFNQATEGANSLQTASELQAALPPNS